MDKMSWIKDLVQAEQKMEETGVVDYAAVLNPEYNLQRDSIHFLQDLKTAFVEAVSTFNQLKCSHRGNIKIYGISKTEADFMLFRNGVKLIFSLKQAGVIGARFDVIGSYYLSSPEQTGQSSKREDFLRAQPGAFGDVTWMFKNRSIRMDYLVRYYLSRFVRESAQ